MRENPLGEIIRIQRLLNKTRLLVACVFIFSVVAHLPYLIPGGPCLRYPSPLPLTIDEGTVLYDSFRITCGEVIYRDFFQFQGPVFYHIYAGLFALTGPSITAARTLNLFITALTATFIALLVSRKLGFLAGAGAAAVHACLLVPTWPYTYPHWLAEAFALVGVYILTTSSGRARRELVGGVFLGLSAATIHSLGLPILAGCMVALATQGIGQRSWRQACLPPLRVFAGASLAVAPFIIYLGALRALDQMWYGMFEWVFTHYPEGQKEAAMQGYGAHLESYIIAHAEVSRPWRDLAVMALRFIKFLPVFAIWGAITQTAQVVIGMRRRLLDYDYPVIAAAAIAGIAPLFLGVTRADIVHIAFVGSFGLCGMALALQPLVIWKPRLHLPAIVLVLVGIVAIGNFSAKTVKTYRSSRAMLDWRGEILRLGMGRWIDINLRPDERIVTAHGGLQYLYIRRAAVGFTFLPHGSPTYYSNDQWQEMGGQIFKARPSVIEVTVEQWLELTKRTPALTELYKIIAFGYKRDSLKTSQNQRSTSDPQERLLLRLSGY